MHLRSIPLAACALALSLLASCGGGSGSGGDEPQQAWSTTVEVADLPGYVYAGTAQREGSGGLSVSLSSFNTALETGWLRREPGGSWSQVPAVPMEVRTALGQTYLLAWTADNNGPRAALVYDDGYRFDTATWTDTDPRPEHLEPFERSAAGWTRLPDMLLPGNSRMPCLYAQDGTARASCIAKRPGINFGTPYVFDYAPQTGWQAAGEFDFGTPAIAYLGFRSLAGEVGGDALAVWERGATSLGVPLHTAYHLRTAGGAWGALGTLPEVNPQRMGAVVALGGGNFMVPHVACQTLKAEYPQSFLCSPAVQHYQAGAGWQASVDLQARITTTYVSQAGFIALEPFLSPPTLLAGRAGQALAVWADGKGGQWSRLYTPANGWEAAVSVPFALDLSGAESSVRFDAAGRATVVSRAGAFRFDSAGGWRQLAPPPWPSETTGIVLSSDAAGVVTAVWGVRTSTAIPGRTKFFSARF